MGSRWRGRAILLVVVGALTAALVLVVVPALAGPKGGPTSVPGGIVPEVVRHIGGDWVTDCSAVGSNPDSGIWISNPTDGTYTSESGVAVLLTVNEDEQQFRFDLTGGRAMDAIVKGGVNSNWYAYDFEGGPGPAKTDGSLGAPETKKKSPTNLSHISICLDTSGGSISGQKWRDHNSDGLPDSFEAGLDGWTIKAFDGAGVEVGSAPTATVDGVSGMYTISGLALDETYTVCEVPPAEASGFEYRGWIQSVPSGSTACSAYTGAEPSGHSVTITGDVADIDFFNVRTITVPGTEDPQTFELICDPEAEPFRSGGGQIGTFTVGDGVIDPIGTVTIDVSDCKPGEYVFETYIDHTKQPEEQVALFTPVIPTSDRFALTETYEWVIIGDLTQKTLYYDDGAGERAMLFCTVTTTEIVLPGTHTSCLLNTTEEPSSTGVLRFDTVYTLIDGRRTLR